RPTADADAKAFYDLVTDPKYLGVPAARMTLLLSAADPKRNGEVATHEAVLRAVNLATSETGKDDLVILAFFGRGTSAGDKTALFTADTVLKDRAKTALIGSDLDAPFKKLKAGQRVLLLLDVSYKGFDPGTEKVPEPTLRDVINAVYGAEDKE